MRNDLLLEMFSTSSRLARAHFHLQVAIHKLIRVQPWRVTRQEEHLDQLPVLLEPGLNHFAVMNPQVIQHQKYFTSRILNQALPSSAVRGLIFDFL